MKRQHIIILTALLLAILIALLGGKTVAHSEEILIKDSLINMRDVAISDLNDEFNILNEEFGLLKTEYEKSEEKSVSLNSQLVLIENSLKDAKSELEKTKVEKQNAIWKMQKLQTQILEYTGSEDYLSSILKEKNETITRLEAEKLELEKLLADEKSKNEMLVAKLQEIQIMIATKSDSIFYVSEQINNIIEDKNYVNAQQQIKQLIKEKENLHTDIENLNNNIKIIKKDIPAIYSPIAYYYGVIKKHVPGKILRQKDIIKFYLDENDDFALDITDIYFTFDINRQIFFDTTTVRKLRFEISGTNLDDKLTFKYNFAKDKTKFDEKIFENLSLTNGEYFISIFEEPKNIKLIEDYKFILN